MLYLGAKRSIIAKAVQALITGYAVKPYAGVECDDGLLTGGRYTQDHFNPGGGSENIYTFCTVDIRFAANNGVTLTRGYAGGSAARLQFTTAAAQAVFWNTAIAPTAGTYSLKFKLRSTPGAGSQNLRYGSTALTPVTVNESGWTTVSLQFTTTGTDWRSGFLTGDGTNTPDVLIDEIQFYLGVLADVPAFSTEVFSKDYRPAMAYAGSQKRSGKLYDNSALGGSGVLRLPTFPATKSFTELTVLVAFRNDVASNNGTVICADFDSTLGTSITSLALGVNTAGSPLFYPSPTNFSKVTILNEGLHILGIKLKANTRSIFFHEMELASDTTAWPGLVSRLLRVGSSGSSLNSHLSTWQMRGQIAGFNVCDTFLSDADYHTAVKVLREKVVQAGAVMAQIPGFLISMGDSQTASFTGARGPSWAVLQADAGRYSPTLNMRNFAVGGYTLANLVSQIPTVTKLISEVNKVSGRKAIVAIYTGTNDQTAIVASPSGHWANIVSTLINPIVAAGGIPVIGTLCPDGGSPPVGFEAARLVFNSLIRASGHAVMDFGGDAVMGNVANCTGPNYDSDFRHFSTAGQVLLANIAQPSIQLAMA